MTEDLQNVLSSVILSPESAFPKEKEHLAIRLTNAVSSLSVRAEAQDRKELLTKILDVLDNRRKNRPDTLFIINPGGSGSHWLQDVVAAHFRAAPCGEVYIPPAALQCIKKARPLDRGILLDFFHLISSDLSLDDMLSCSFINTAHVNGWRLSAWMPQQKTIILLVRNPVDVVLSRTFRKPHYRNLYFKHEDDWEYLNRNINYLKSFYSKKKPDTYDLVVKYEDMKNNMSNIMRMLNIKSKLQENFGDIEISISKHLSEPQIISNKFKGELLEINDAFIYHAREQLLEISTDLGYTYRD